MMKGVAEDDEGEDDAICGKDAEGCPGGRSVLAAEEQLALLLVIVLAFLRGEARSWSAGAHFWPW